jgi:enediyne biosynthesis thioesterase
MRAFEYKHTVGFEETNLVGNVYYVNHLRWQGRCRELFLREHAPDILQRLRQDLRLVTTRCNCDYLAELCAFDEITVRMRLKERVQNRLVLAFEYVKILAGSEEIVARGEQEIACMRIDNGSLVPTSIPESLRRALEKYSR